MLKLLHFCQIFLASWLTLRQSLITSVSMPGKSWWVQVNKSLCSIRSCFSRYLISGPILVQLFIVSTQTRSKIMSSKGSFTLPYIKPGSSYISNSCSTIGLSFDTKVIKIENSDSNNFWDKIGLWFQLLWSLDFK